MTKENNQNNLKQIIDNLLLINLFTVIFFAIFFIFAIIMQLNGVFIFINFIQRVWNPLIVPLITVLKILLGDGAKVVLEGQKVISTTLKNFNFKSPLLEKAI